MKKIIYALLLVGILFLGLIHGEDNLYSASAEDIPVKSYSGDVPDINSNKSIKSGE